MMYKTAIFLRFHAKKSMSRRLLSRVDLCGSFYGPMNSSFFDKRRQDSSTFDKFLAAIRVRRILYCVADLFFSSVECFFLAQIAI